MISKWTLHISIFTVLLVILLELVPTASGDCCTSTKISYRLQPQSKWNCEYFGGQMTDKKKKTCTAALCGSMHTPTPCCGRQSCNIFCCNCDSGCHSRNHLVFKDFIKQYGKFVDNIQEITK